MIEGTEILPKTFAKLVSRMKGEKISTTSCSTEIADDSDWHRTKIGYMTYTNIYQTPKWVLGLGYKTGSYPGDVYKQDILAIPIKDVENHDINSVIKQASYFKNSLIVLIEGSLLAISKNSFFSTSEDSEFEKIARIITEKEAIFDSSKYDLSAGLQICTKRAAYKDTAPEILATFFAIVLCHAECNEDF